MAAAIGGARAMRLVKGLEFVSVACDGVDVTSLRRNIRHFKHVFEEVLDVLPTSRYRIEQMFVEHVF
ncbi:hypothetical protein QU670_06645 [Actinomyces massiliensis]|nr:hypothetical protein [Actinomyces massiliensis]WLD72905.1 hypothetical protein QU670_06645 [Actinomyces massiliensis]